MQPAALQTRSTANVDFTICLQAERPEILALANLINAEYHEAADAIMWRDAFCHECGDNECALGTALQLARKIHASGWVTITGNLNIVNLNCPRCTEHEPAATDDEVRADLYYDELMEK